MRTRRVAVLPELHAIVVLGCPVSLDGRASVALARRTALGVRLFSSGRARQVIFSGGITRPGLPSEACAAAQAARALGLPDSAAVLEELSSSTEENARYVAAMLGREARVVVVTDDFHAPRAHWIFEQHFAHVESEAASSSMRDRIRGGARELPLLALLSARLVLARRGR